MKTVGKLLVVLAVAAGMGTARGQDNHGSRRHRHGSRPAASTTDGSRSAASGAVRRADPQTAAFLRRVDTNHNGMIDEDELTGAAKTIVEGILTRLGIELKYPIPLSKIVASPRADRGTESGGDNGDEPSAQDESSSEQSGSPSVRGFERPKSSVPTVLGFGQTSDESSGSKSKSEPTATAGMSSKRTRSAKTGDASSKTSSTDSESPADAPKKTGPKSGRFLTPRERLPKGLPDWFREKDVNGDGQVDMAEFASEWTPALVNEFNRYDLNHDGVITPAECLKVEGRSSKAK